MNQRLYKGLRKPVQTVSNNSRYSHIFYEGAPESHEDIADYLDITTLRGVRVG